MDYEIFMRGPEAYIPYIILLLLYTVAGYCAFPLLFAKFRKKQIGRKKYKHLCYGINLVAMVIYAALGGGSSGGPYLLWTWIFSNIGVKILDKRGLLENAVHLDYAQTETYKAALNEDVRYKNDEDFDCKEKYPAAETELKNLGKDQTDELPNTFANSLPKTVQTEKPEIRFCRKCGFKLLPGSEFCSKCGARIIRTSDFDEI